MKMMASKNILFNLCIAFVSVLTLAPSAFTAKIDIPPCPSETQRVFHPTAQRPLWTGCKDKADLYQGLLIQFSNQTEILRIAGIKNSLREGKEIRFGNSGTLEERHFKNGHLHKASFIYESSSPLGRLMPKAMPAKDWQSFNETGDHSLLKGWLNQSPKITLQFENGRLTRMQYDKIDYKFTLSPEGMIRPTNHPELKESKGMFFIDTEPLWVLNADDMKKALLPGFGTCKKYAGPIGRYTRSYDHYLFKREPSESKQYFQLKTIRDRLIKFCIPDDIIEHLGTLECPPQLPSERPPKYCAIPMSDQLHLPYQPKYFKNEFTYGRTPEEFLNIAIQAGLLKFAGDYEKNWDVLTLAPGIQIMVKKTARGIFYQQIPKDKKGNPVIKKPSESNRNWWEWVAIPGFTSY